MVPNLGGVVWGKSLWPGRATKEACCEQCKKKKWAVSHAVCQRHSSKNASPWQWIFALIMPDIAGLVAAMTESDLSSVALAKEELDVVGERAYPTSLVDRDSPDRSGFGGSVDVGELCFVLRSVHSREAVPASNFHWHHGCYGWLAKFYNIGHK